MLINSSAINSSVLYSALFDEVTRLRRLCSQEQMTFIQKKITQAESHYLQLQRQFTRQYNRHHNQQHNQQCLERQLQVCFSEVSGVKEKLMKENRELVGSLNRLRGAFRQQQSTNRLYQEKNKQNFKELQEMQEQLKRKQLLKEDFNEDLNNISKEKINNTRNIRDLEAKIENLRGQLTQSYNVKTSISTTNQLLQKDLNCLKEQFRQMHSKNSKQFPQLQLMIDKELEEQGRATQEQKWRASQLDQRKGQLTMVQGQIVKQSYILESLEGAQKKVTDKINQSLKVGQKIETNIFGSKVQITNYRNKNEEVKKKIQLLTKYKAELVELVTLF